MATVSAGNVCSGRCGRANRSAVRDPATPQGSAGTCRSAPTGGRWPSRHRSRRRRDRRRGHAAAPRTALPGPRPCGPRALHAGRALHRRRELQGLGAAVVHQDLAARRPRARRAHRTRCSGWPRARTAARSPPAAPTAPSACSTCAPGSRSARRCPACPNRPVSPRSSRPTAPTCSPSPTPGAPTAGTCGRPRGRATPARRRAHPHPDRVEGRAARAPLRARLHALTATAHDRPGQLATAPASCADARPSLIALGTVALPLKSARSPGRPRRHQRDPR